jgi:hypothetical protein
MLHRFHRSFVLRPLCALVAFALVAPLAFPLGALADEDDTMMAAPPDAGVARLSVIDGTAGIQRGDATAPVAAVVNAPVLAGDYVTTGQGSRAEVQFDGTAAVRLGENVQMHVTQLRPDDRQIQLAAGTIDLRLLRGTDGASSIDTPSVSIVPRASGSYRVAVGDDGTTFVSVRSGRADVETPQGAQSLVPGTTLIAQGTASNPQITSRDAIAFDSFDSFNDDLDRAQLAALGNSPYVDTDIGGVSDLSANGTWVDDGSYGHVWLPSNVGRDWAPYRSGSWVTAGPYGYTWVAAEPWGWAPYHYGRWYFSAAYNHWAWFPPAPGRIAPVWSPALVGFVGVGGGGVSVGIGFGGAIGWVPLAPYEAGRPWWGPHAATFGASVAYGSGAYGAGYRNARYNGVSSANVRGGRFGAVTAASSYGATPSYARGYAQPAYDRAGDQAPAYARPAYQSSAYARPSYQSPAYARPAYQSPGYATSYARSAYQAPGYARAAYQTPGYARSAYQAPGYQPGYQRSYAGRAAYGAGAAQPSRGYGRAEPASRGGEGYGRR